MNKEIIDKWLDEEYGTSYTELEKLHDFVLDQDMKHCEQRDKYKEAIDKAIEIYEKRNTCEYKKKRFMEDKNTSDLMYEILKGEE